ncbi:MAG: hypothetical protein IJA03_05945 [Bacteroidaceae bacterium]|nr:hypothetical protein [Bacteroidaceae bacterium]
MNLYKIIKQNQKLAEKRNPAFDTNRFAKFLMYFMIVYWAAIFLFLGVSLPFMFEGLVPNMEPYHIMNQGILYVMAGDFLMRFMAQPSVSQEIKPYLLMPVKRKKLISLLLLKSGLDGYNFIWFFVYVPFAFLTVIRFYGFGGMFLYLIGIWLIFVFNNYWYLLCKLLLGEKTLWLLLPTAIFGALGAAEFLLDGLPISRFTMDLGEGFIEGNPLSFLFVLACIGVMFLINLKLQQRMIYNELSKKEDTKIKRVSEYKFLDKYGEVGEYIRLEIKLITRNKTVKTQFRMGIIVMLGFSFALAFTDVYDGSYMTSFICLYNYAILPIMTLGQVMCFEGNYIDGLMSRKESIFNLLRAKYYLTTLIILVPFLIMFFPIAKGKITLLTAVAYLIFVAGFVFFMLLQLAVYNTRTLPLNANLMKSNKSSNWIQGLITGCAFMLPLLIDKLLSALLPEEVAHIILIVIGLGFIATHNLWIKNIYKRFMKRRYKNMEEFRASR